MRPPAATPATATAADDTALPRRWEWLVRGFQKYSVRYVRKHFHAVRLSKTSHPLPTGAEPLLIVLNHPAWWDPLTCFVLSRLLPGREQYGAIDAVAVQKYGFFKRLGFVGVDSKSLRGAIEFLRTGEAILSRPNRVYWVTAQGKFTDARVRPLGLRSGVGHLAERLDRGLVVPLAVEYPFWNESTPEVLVRFGEPLSVADQPGLRGKAWTAHIEAAVTDALDGLCREAISRDPGLFTTLVEGRTGVGGVYDAWRRSAAWVRGRRFDPSHEAAAGDPGGGR